MESVELRHPDNESARKRCGEPQVAQFEALGWVRVEAATDSDKRADTPAATSFGAGADPTTKTSKPSKE